MGIVDNFMNQTIDTISSVTRDAYNKETLTTVYSDVKCRWQKSKMKSISALSDTLEYRVIVWIPSDYTDITTSHIVTQDSEKYKIVNIENEVNLEGELDHIVLYLV